MSRVLFLLVVGAVTEGCGSNGTRCGDAATCETHDPPTVGLDVSVGRDSGPTDAHVATLDVRSQPHIGACDQRSTVGYCVEYQFWAPLDDFRGSCTGTWADAPCPRTDAIGGCRRTATTGDESLTTWFYVGGPFADAAEAEAECERDPTSDLVPI